MTDKQIRIDITSRDDASGTLDEVADAAEAVEKLSPEVDVTADTGAAQSDLDSVDRLVDALDARAAEVDVTADTSSATSGLDDVESAADAVAKLTPEVDVTADTSSAVTDLDSLKSDADTLTDADREIILKAKVKDAQDALKSLRGGLDDTSKKADDVKADMDQIGSSDGPRLAGNHVADLTGPFGDASGAAGDFGGIFDGLSDISESVGSKIGKDLSGVASSLGLAGFAVAGVAAGWTYFSQKAEEAKKKALEAAEAQREINEALKEGDIKAAADKLVESYGDVFDAAGDAGISVSQTTQYIRGAADTLPDLDRALADNATAIEETRRKQDAYYKSTGFLDERLADHQEELLSTRTRLRNVRDAVDGARRKNIDLNGTIADQDKKMRGVRDGLRKTIDNTDDLAKSNKKAKDSVEDLDEALSKLKDQLSFERTMARFAEDFATAFRKVKHGKELTSEEILTLKEDVLDVAEFAKLHPAQVRALLRKIKRGDIAGVRNDVQAYMDEHTVETPAGIRVLPDAARNAHDDAQNQLNNQGPVQVPTVYAPPAPGGTGTPGGRPQPISVLPGPTPAPVTNVTMYLPRGYREADVIAAGRRAARRSGGLYRRFHR